MRPILAFSLPLAAVFAAVPASAQDGGAEKVNQLIIYGDDPCPASSGDQITVCARKEERERYRIPEPLRNEPGSPRNEPWTQRVQAYETVGASGTNSCSPVGAGGFTGCMTRVIDAAYAEQRASGDSRFGRLIADEREKRLSTIDTEAAATQSRVEQLEKEYDAKVARERAAETSGPDAPLPTPPAK